MDAENVLYAILELLVLYLIAVIWGELGTRALPAVGAYFCQRPKLITGEHITPSISVKLPPLLGMLLSGILLANVPGSLLADIPSSWSAAIKKLALAVILSRAGLGLNIKALWAKGVTTLRLASVPCLTEATLVTFLTRLFRPETPWPFCATLGFVLAAVSPAVVVPSILALQEAMYGIKKGIPTMILAAASLDDVIAICGFGVVAGIGYTAAGAGSGDGVLMAALSAPISIFGGLFLGWIAGLALSWPKRGLMSALVCARIRFGALLFTSLIIVFGADAAGFAGGGYLATMVAGTVSANGWKAQELLAEGVVEEPQSRSACSPAVAAVAGYFKSIWSGPAVFPCVRAAGAGATGMQPALFMLIGAAVDIDKISSDEVGVSFAVILIALCARLVVTYLSVGGSSADLVFWERLFVAVAWFPKATVQAAVGAEVLDKALEQDVGSDAREELEPVGRFILTAAVLSIIITAPLGAIGMFVAGPRWLQKFPQQNRAAGITAVDQPKKAADAAIGQSTGTPHDDGSKVHLEQLDKSTEAIELTVIKPDGTK